MRNLLLLVALLGLTGCMKVSDMAAGAEYHLRDAGFLDHGRTESPTAHREAETAKAHRG